MRWNELFDDIEAQAEALDRTERDAEVADRTRAEIGRLMLLDRLRSNVGQMVTLRLVGVGTVTGLLERVGADWLLLACPEEVVVPASAVAAVADLPFASVAPAALSPVASRLSLASVLRAIAIDRARVSILLKDGTTIAGTPDRVGGDFVDLAVHDEDVAPRASAVTSRTTVSYPAISKVVRDPGGWA